MSDATREATETAREAAQSRPLEIVARGGLITYGILHLLIGVIALQVAWGGTREEADQSGALQTLAAQPFGGMLLASAAVGLAGLAAWQLSHAIWGFASAGAGRRRRRRLSAAATSLVYLGLAITATIFALGARPSGDESQQSATREMLGLPFGQSIVIAVAAAVIGVGVYQARKAVSADFPQELSTVSMSAPVRAVVTRLGRFGYAAKGVAFGVVGLLLGYAALTFDPEEAQGLDGAMRAIAMQPFGQVLLTIVALGFAAFGIFALAQARYRPM